MGLRNVFSRKVGRRGKFKLHFAFFLILVAMYVVLFSLFQEPILSSPLENVDVTEISLDDGLNRSKILAILGVLVGLAAIYFLIRTIIDILRSRKDLRKGRKRY